MPGSGDHGETRRSWRPLGVARTQAGSNQAGWGALGVAQARNGPRWDEVMGATLVVFLDFCPGLIIMRIEE
jgi:hypothetical protein